MKFFKLICLQLFFIIFSSGVFSQENDVVYEHVDLITYVTFNNRPIDLTVFIDKHFKVEDSSIIIEFLEKAIDKLFDLKIIDCAFTASKENKNKNKFLVNLTESLTLKISDYFVRPTNVYLINSNNIDNHKLKKVKGFFYQNNGVNKDDLYEENRYFTLYFKDKDLINSNKEQIIANIAYQVIKNIGFDCQDQCDGSIAFEMYTCIIKDLYWR